MTDYVIAIPSHRRREMILEKTLAYLAKTDVDLAKVHVFVSSVEDRIEYAAHLPEQVKIVYTGPVKDIVAKFNLIHNHFPIGTKVLVMEDDVDLIIKKTGKNAVAPFFELTKLMKAGFMHCEIEGTALWGIAPHSNTFYMKAEVSTSFKFIVANVYGFISTRNPALQITLHAKSDYQRSILYFIEYGKVVRINHLGVVTKNYKNAGGLQDADYHHNRQGHEVLACTYLTARYPHLVVRNEGKPSMYPELKLRTIAPGGGQDWKALQKIEDSHGGFY